MSLLIILSLMRLIVPQCSLGSSRHCDADMANHYQHRKAQAAKARSTIPEHGELVQTVRTSSLTAARHAQQLVDDELSLCTKEDKMSIQQRLGTESRTLLS